jgi:hypothetical protein
VKKDLYFIGFLVNVDDSILRLQIGDGFSIDKKQQQEIMSIYNLDSSSDDLQDILNKSGFGQKPLPK